MLCLAEVIQVKDIERGHLGLLNKGCSVYIQEPSVSVLSDLAACNF